jgi:hypothetical protein
MANQISDFINGFRGGTRKNRFKVSGTFPDGTASAKLEFHVLSASLPNSTLGIVNFPYRGRLIPYVGDRIYEPWDILVLDDRGSGLYNAFQAWSELINNQELNTHNYGDDDSWFQDDGTGAIQDATWSIQQLDLDGSPIKTITLRSCWPGFISPLQFNMAETGFNSFAVRLNYNYINIQGINDIATGSGTP